MPKDTQDRTSNGGQRPSLASGFLSRRGWPRRRYKMKIFRKILFLPSLLLGMLMAIPVAIAYETIFNGEKFDREVWLYSSGGACGVLAIFGILTFFVFRIKDPTFRLSPMQVRLIWIGAFLMGAIGTPLIVSTL
jgi:nitrate reductase gamma subunit